MPRNSFQMIVDEVLDLKAGGLVLVRCPEELQRALIGKICLCWWGPMDIGCFVPTVKANSKTNLGLIGGIVTHWGPGPTTYGAISLHREARDRGGTIVVVSSHIPGGAKYVANSIYEVKAAAAPGRYDIRLAKSRDSGMWQSINSSEFPWSEDLPGRDKVTSSLILPGGAQAENACDHDYVNVGFTSVKMACKHCGEDEP